MFHIDLGEVVLQLPSIFFAIAVHEFSHAKIADTLGDKTPRRQGRLNLNPIIHMDPVGLLLLMVTGYGWTRPVQVDPSAFKRPRRDELLVALGGPLANFGAAIVFALLTGLFMLINPAIYIGDIGNAFYDVITYFVWTNLLLGFFNLLPIPPLDGYGVLFAILPRRLRRFKALQDRLGGTVLIILVLLEVYFRHPILHVYPVLKVTYHGIMSFLGVD